MSDRTVPADIQKRFDFYTSHFSRHDLHKIHWACGYGDVDVLQYLIISGVDVNMRTSTNFTPLHIAIDAGRPICVELLLKNGADASLVCTHKKLPIHDAAFLGDDECLRLLIKAYPQGVNVRDIYGYIPIWYATSGVIGAVRTKCVRILLEAGSEVDAYISPTSLHTFVSNAVFVKRDYNLAKLFIDYGAKLDLRYLDRDAPPPTEITEYVTHRNSCRLGARAILQLRNRHSKILRVCQIPCGRDVLKLVAKLVWQHRHI